MCRFDLQKDLARLFRAAAIWESFGIFLQEIVPARQFYLFQAPALKATKGFGGFLQEIGTVSTYSPENNLAGPLCVANARKAFGIFLPRLCTRS